MEHKQTIREIILTNVADAINDRVRSGDGMVIELRKRRGCVNTNDSVIEDGYSRKQGILAAVGFSDEFDRQTEDLVLV